MLIGRSESTAIDDAVGELEPKELRRAAKAFRKLDDDQNGYLDFEEFKELLHAAELAGGRSWDKASAKRLFDKSDLNKDGRLDFNEYVIMKQRSVNTDARRRTLTIATRVATAAAAARSGTDSALPEFIVKRREDAARRDSVVAEERAAAAERQKKRFTAHDLLGSLTDDEVEVLIELCGGAAASVEPHAADAQFSLLEMRVGKMFDAAEIGEVIERAAAKAKDGRVYVALLVEEIEALRAAASPRPDQRRASMR